MVHPTHVSNEKGIKMRVKRIKAFNLESKEREIPITLIDVEGNKEDYEEKELRARAAYFMLNGAPSFAVNALDNGRYKLLSAERDFLACVELGVGEVVAKIYKFTEKNAEVFSLTEKLKDKTLGAMDEAYMMSKLVELGLTQEDIASLVGISRPAVANTLRLLTLAPEVVGLVESGKLSAGHARTLVKVEKEKQYAFASECISRGYSVREMERAVKAYLTPPEILQQEKDAKQAAKSAELKALVERMRGIFRTKVSLIGNDKKGRIYIDYYTPEDLYRLEEFLDIIESFDGRA